MSCLCTGRADIRCDDTHCDLAAPGEPFNPNQCRLCWNRLGFNQAVLNDAVRGDPERERVRASLQRYPLSVRSKRSCGDLGLFTGERRDCAGCGGQKQMPVHHCTKHGRCSPTGRLFYKENGELREVKTCLFCADYQPQEDARQQPAITTRHLHFFIYPANTGGVWQRWAGILRRRMDLFNGRRLISIVTGPGLDPPEKVQEAFQGAAAEFLVLPNNPQLRETLCFIPQLKKLKTDNPHEAIFFGHAKGAAKPVNPGATSHLWGRVMYQTCLDYWPYVEKLLDVFPIVGSFKKSGCFFEGSKGVWHYSGTFFWARSAELFKRGWNRIDPTWWGSESYPGLHFAPEEAGCIFYDGGSGLNLYELGTWRGKVWPAYQQWRKEHQHEQTDWEALAKMEEEARV